MKTIEAAITGHRVVSREEWLQERVALLELEKAHTRERDEISRQRRELPWVRVEKEYFFEGPEGKVTLADLFDGRSQLFIKHFMMGPARSRNAWVAHLRLTILKACSCTSRTTISHTPLWLT